MVLKVIAVTGAAGMLGRHIIAALEFSGFDTISISRLTATDRSWRQWDLNQWQTEKKFDEVFKSVDAIVHAGAAVPNREKPYSEQELFDVNVRATLNLADWARKRKVPLVYISGAIVYKKTDAESILEDSALGWSGLGGFYGMTKLLAENQLIQEKNSGLELAIIRTSSIYGYGLSSDKLICSFLEKAHTGSTIELMEPIKDSVDFIHAADVSVAVVNILKNKSWSIFNISSGQFTSIHKLAELAVSIVKNGDISVQQSNQEVGKKAARFGLECKKAKVKLGWRVNIGITEGMRSVFEKQVLVVGRK